MSGETAGSSSTASGAGILQMRRMIEDLLDVGSIDSGRLAIDPREHEMGELFQDAVELSAPLIADKRIEIKIEMPAAAVQGPLRSRADDAGLFQPDWQRREVRPRAGDHRSLRGRLRHERAGLRAGHRARAFRPRACRTCFSATGRPTRPRARDAASASSSPRGSSRPRAGVIWAESQVGAGRRSSLRCRWRRPSRRRGRRRGRASAPPNGPRRDSIRDRETVSAPTIDAGVVRSVSGPLRKSCDRVRQNRSMTENFLFAFAGSVPLTKQRTAEAWSSYCSAAFAYLPSSGNLERDVLRGRQEARGDARRLHADVVCIRPSSGR